MSRHRFVRNLDLDNELADDDAFSDEAPEDPYENITEEEREQLEVALSAALDVLGPSSTSGIADRSVKDALWDSYFDVEAAVGHVLEEKSREQAAQRRREEKEAARKRAQASSAPASKPGSGANTPARGISAGKSNLKPSKPSAGPISTLRADIEGLGLSDAAGSTSEAGSSAVGSGSAPNSSVAGTPKLAIAHERIVEEARKREREGKAELSLVVVGHVDAGKSTLMGRLLHELGSLTDKEHLSNERASQKIGKGSFAYAWALDGTQEERERGVTIEVAQDHFSTPHRHFTLLDAPGHRDFIPNMIGGAAQADAALLVVDAAKGAFEAGFGPQGQTREHALLVRALGVTQLLVVVNKLDAVAYDQSRFDEIVAAMRPFLSQSGFDPSKLTFVPCGAAAGENLAKREENGTLSAWYDGPTLVDVLDKLNPPARALDAPLRMPVTNVFRGQTAVASGVGVSGRIVSGVLQIGDRLRVVPGDESGVVRAIEVDNEAAPWAVAGASVTVYMSSIDQIHINIGSVLCPPTAPVALCTNILAQVIVFEPTYPLVAGTSVELFHHAVNLPATLSQLVATLDKSSGAPLKNNPRVLPQGATAQVRIGLRAGGAPGQSAGAPIEVFRENKEMGRILLRRNGETVAAGIVLETS